VFCDLGSEIGTDRGLATRQIAFDTRYWTGKQWVARH
jgi:hypothetical protein